MSLLTDITTTPWFFRNVVAYSRTQDPLAGEPRLTLPKRGGDG